MNREELLALPAVVDVGTAADVLGVGRSCAYGMVRSGQWPTQVLRCGRYIRVPTAPLLELLGIERVAMRRDSEQGSERLPEGA